MISNISECFFILFTDMFSCLLGCLVTLMVCEPTSRREPVCALGLCVQDLQIEGVKGLRVVGEALPATSGY